MQLPMHRTFCSSVILTGQSSALTLLHGIQDDAQNLIVDGKAVAHAGELHPRIVAKYGLPERCCGLRGRV